MKITTTFWGDEVHIFNHLLYIKNHNDEVMFQSDLNDMRATALFFKNIAKFMKTDEVKKTIDEFEDNPNYYQFAVRVDDVITNIKWFNLVIHDKLTISHDLAFETTLISKNKLRMTFGNFPMYYDSRNIKLPKYHSLNIKAKAYKFIANQILKNLR